MARPYDPLTLRPPTNIRSLDVDGKFVTVALSRVEAGAHDLWICSVAFCPPVGTFPDGRQCAQVLAYTIPGAIETQKSPLDISRQFFMRVGAGEDPHKAEYVQTFFLKHDHPRSITCLRCRMESFSLGDIDHKFCDRCHHYHNDFPPEGRLAWLQEGVPFDARYGC